MDQLTLDAYDRDAAVFAKEWGEQPTPSDLQELVQRFFRPGSTADIGCGSGRDTAWLNAAGFPAIGYDASEGLLTEARRLYPGIRFERAILPELEGFGTFTNVFCETVIMHLDSAQIGPSVRRLIEIVEPGGVLYLSWRVVERVDLRDEHGRLYTAFDPEWVLAELADHNLWLDEERLSTSSGKVVRRIVVRRN